MEHVDTVIVGAGAAGQFCAALAGQRGQRVLLLDHARTLAEKIRISGGGRCNFTNLAADSVQRFLGEDAGFARHALRAYPPRRFIELLGRHGIGHHEKHRGQLFCDAGSEAIIAMLRRECTAGHVAIRHPVSVAQVLRDGQGRFLIGTNAGELSARNLVIATGGLSIPKIGASDFGHRLARSFGLRIVEPRPGLVPLTFDARGWQPFAALAGVGIEVRLRIAADALGRPTFDEDLLFTHRGLSGPAVLQISSYWRPGEALLIDLAGGRDLQRLLRECRDASRQQLDSLLAQWLPKRLASGWLACSPHAAIAGRRVAELGNRQLDAVAAGLRGWQVTPVGTAGYSKAEVTVGGVATAGLDPRTMQAREVPGLHFIGEVVDVTGWLGGYNFQWAWASAWCAAMAISR